MVLHTINKPPQSSRLFQDCIETVYGEHAVLLIEDGVYAALSNTESGMQISQHSKITFYALENDIVARGIEDRIVDTIQLLDYQGFVRLVTECSSVQSWF